ncbi:MAG: NfeD family protein [Candidatus Kapaibacteriota bacterium]|jgi:membrane-bound serine protease (ClpP class)
MKILVQIIFIIFTTYYCISSEVVLIKINSAITPSSSSQIKKALDWARGINAEALIIQLNTPGGLLESTREIVQNILTSPVPVIVYVSPSGARAGSAGVFITLAANIAAMAPGTNIGAAHPVGLQGKADSSAMGEKIVNDAAAFIRSIAQQRNRNVSWAERAVRESISSTEREALAENVIDLVASSVDSLLILIDGKVITNGNGTRVLKTKDAKVVEYELSFRDKFLDFISNPNVAYILLMIGIYGILFELYNPGSIFPGVIGALSLILAGYSLQMLPVNYAGLALIILAIVLFLLEIKITSYGLLTLGGLASLFIGSLMLIDAPGDFMEISLSLIITAVVVTFLFFTFVITLGIKAQFKKKETGFEGLVGTEGKVIEKINANQRGKILVRGEIWSATSDVDIPEGQLVIVVKADSFTLFVKPK